MRLEKSALKSTILQDGILIVCVLVLMLSVLWRDAHSPWAFERKKGSVADNFFIALNAKNISQGLGWGLYNGLEFVPFEREISTGPVVFLPVAFAMQWVPDMDDARYAGTIGLNLLLLGVFLWRLKGIFASHLHYRCAWLLLPLLMLSFMREQWYLVLGEVAASLLLLISASCVVKRELTTREILVSGLLAGMALMSKLISILCSPWIFLFLVVSQWQHGYRVVFRSMVCWVAAFCFVPGLVASWHWIGLAQGLPGLMAYTKDYLSYYFGLGWTGEVESTFCIDPKCLLANHRTASSSWMHAYGRSLAYGVVAVPLLLAGALWKKPASMVQRYTLLIALMCSSQLFFFYINGIHWQSRYYFIAGFLGMAAAVCVLSWLSLFDRYKFRWGLTLCLLIVAIAGSRPWYREVGMEASHRDAREVANYLNQSPSIHEALWINRAPYPFPFVDFYLEEGKFWIHPYGFISRYFYWEEKQFALENRFFWKERRSHYVLLEKWDGALLEELEVCEIQHFENKHFKVLECRPDELEVFYRRYTEGQMRFG